MRFTAFSAALVAFSASVLAQDPTKGFDPLSKPTPNQLVDAGSNLTITWEYTDTYKGTVTIGLVGGATQGTQIPILTVATSVDNSLGSYNWIIPATLGKDAVYGLKVTYDQNTTIFQWSNPFRIQPVGGSGGSSSSSSSGSSTSTSSSTSTGSTSTGKSTTTTASGSGSPSTSGSTTTTTTTSVSVPPSSTTKSSGNTTSTTTTSSSSSSSTSTVPTAAADRVYAGSFAVLGGLAAVALAL